MGKFGGVPNNNRYLNCFTTELWVASGALVMSIMDTWLRALLTCFVSPNLVPRVLSYSSPEARGKGPENEVVKVLVKRHLEYRLNEP